MFQFPTINNTKLAVVQTSVVGVTPVTFNVVSSNFMLIILFKICSFLFIYFLLENNMSVMQNMYLTFGLVVLTNKPVEHRVMHVKFG
jgi:hypothetical protein